jgi:hypothetical protein
VKLFAWDELEYMSRVRHVSDHLALGMWGNIRNLS